MALFELSFCLKVNNGSSLSDPGFFNMIFNVGPAWSVNEDLINGVHGAHSYEWRVEGSHSINALLIEQGLGHSRSL